MGMMGDTRGGIVRLKMPLLKDTVLTITKVSPQRKRIELIGERIRAGINGVKSFG